MVRTKKIMSPEAEYVALVNSFNRGRSDALTVTRACAIARLLGFPEFEIKYYPDGSSRTLMIVHDEFNSI